ncbi:MAG TPA: tetratricopeptide repeat protein [Casimicrobiaceae bacterium]|jgi:predicted negative regulator of RcsB-dependent stress response|nr:tetratricopeptide repeat protein [Casimicrobiaceae bacterium]
MPVYDLEEQEKIDDLKAWWASNGKYVSAVVVSVAVVVIGMQGWRWYQGTQAAKASVLYQAVSQAARDNDLAKAKEPASQVVERFGGTTYAPRAVLLYAKLLYDAGDKAGAKAQLQWVIDHAGEDELKAVARFRMAQVLLDDKEYDEALKTLDAKTDEAFAGVYADLRGDVLAAAGKTQDARSAYQVALAKLDPKSGYRSYLQAKLDALGGPLPGATAAPAAASALPPAAPAR